MAPRAMVRPRARAVIRTVQAAGQLTRTASLRRRRTVARERLSSRTRGDPAGDGARRGGGRQRCGGRRRRVGRARPQAEQRRMAGAVGGRPALWVERRDQPLQRPAVHARGREALRLARDVALGLEHPRARREVDRPDPERPAALSGDEQPPADERGAGDAARRDGVDQAPHGMDRRPGGPLVRLHDVRCCGRRAGRRRWRSRPARRPATPRSTSPSGSRSGRASRSSATAGTAGRRRRSSRSGTCCRRWARPGSSTRAAAAGARPRSRPRRCRRCGCSPRPSARRPGSRRPLRPVSRSAGSVR